MSYVLDVTNLCKTYIINKRQNNVLRNIQMNMEEGEFVSIMGPWILNPVRYTKIRV